jgi:hypothetical protein
MSSEQLGSGENVLKGNLGGAWDIKHGYAGAYTDLGIARRFGGAAAAFSLRDIGAMNGEVVKVRRDVDGEVNDPEINFSANQVSSGVLEDWVNGKLIDELPADKFNGVTVVVSHDSLNSGASTTIQFYKEDNLTTSHNNPRFQSNDGLYQIFYGSGSGDWIFELMDTGSGATQYARSVNANVDFPYNVTDNGGWTAASGTLNSITVTATTPAAAAFSLRKVNSAYGIPTTVVNGTDGFPTTITSSEQSITGTSFTVRHFSNNSPDSSEATAVNGVYRVSATKTSSSSFAKAIRIKGLEDGKQYVVKGEFRMVEDTTSGGDSVALVDISDNSADTDEDSVSTASTTFVPFLIDAGYNSGGADNFIDFTVSAVGSETGTITAEFRNVEIIENENSAVRIRRSSDDVEVTVGFDSEDKVSLNSPIVNHSEDSNPDTQTTTATDLSGFLNETKSNSFTSIIQSDIHNFNHWDSASSSSTDNNETFTLSATQGTASQTGARWAFNLPATISATDSSLTTFRVSGTLVNYTSSTGSLNSSGFFIKQGKNNNTSSSSDFGNLTDHTGVGTIQVNKLRFNPGDSGDFSFVCQGDDEDFRSFVFLQTNLTGGTISISFTNLKFEIIKHGASVHTWYDQAGANNAVQETAANQPQIASSGALLADGLKFDGSNDMLTNSDVGAMQASDGMSSFTVHKKRVASTSTTFGDDNPQYLYHLVETSLADTVLAHRILGGELSILRANTAGDDYIITRTTNHLIGTTKNLSSAIGSSGFQNHFNATTPAEDVENTGTSFDSTTTEFTIGAQDGLGGGTRFYDGHIEELIIYKSDQSANRFKIESNINNYYGLYNDENELVSDFAKSGLATISNASKDGFTGQTTDGNDAYFGVELNEKVASSDIVYISFNSTKASSTGDGVGLRKTSIGGTLAQSSITSFAAGFNSIALTSSDSDAKFISFVDDSDASFTISNFRVSRIARNGLVETWYDQSDNGNNATQDTATNQPSIIQNGGLVKVNNKPAISFDGSDNYLILDTEVKFNSTASDKVNSIFNVALIVAGNRSYLGLGSGNRNWFGVPYLSNYYYRDNNGNELNTADAVPLNQQISFTFVSDASNDIETYQNGSSIHSTNSVFDTHLRIKNFGRSYNSANYQTMSSQELIMFADDKTSEIADLHNEINNHYNIY